MRRTSSCKAKHWHGGAANDPRCARTKRQTARDAKFEQDRPAPAAPDRHAPCRNGDRRMDRVDAWLVRRRGFRRRILRLCRRSLAALGRRHARAMCRHGPALRAITNSSRHGQANQDVLPPAGGANATAGSVQAGVPDRAAGARSARRTGQACRADRTRAEAPDGGQPAPEAACAAIELRRSQRGAAADCISRITPRRRAADRGNARCRPGGRLPRR